MNIGRPWMGGSGADHFLVSLPYPYGPALETCELGERHVRFLWLVPITAAEAGLVRSRGMDALESMLKKANVDVVSPNVARLSEVDGRLLMARARAEEALCCGWRDVYVRGCRRDFEPGGFWPTEQFMH